VTVPEHVAIAFAASGSPVLLPGGELRTYRCAGIVLRHENEKEIADAIFAADVFDAIAPSDEFRVPRPVRAPDGGWIVDGWSAWTYVEGREAGPADVPAGVRAIEAFHRAIANVPRPPHLARRALIYDRADRGAFGDMPAGVDDRLRPTLARLYALRRPVDGLRDQVIHGDANGANILVAPGVPPAIIDFAPYWRPPEFALAVTAYWMGAYRYDPGVFGSFEHLRHFDQLLLRACIRSLLVMDGFGHAEQLRAYEKSIDAVTGRLAK
jgi:uncharacterized protein (TIGR02569 family)